MVKKIQFGLKRLRSWRFYPVMLCMFVALIAIVFSRVWAGIALRHRTVEQAVPWVNVVSAQPSPVHEKIILPGTVRAWHEASIYARTNGYIKTWCVDIGDHVKKGQLLAQIETPELDAQLRQAEADLNVTIARNELAQMTAKRWLNLLSTDSVSKQETDEKIHEASALAASVIAERANRDRLKELVGFERVTAPFAGTISERHADLGMLVDAGSSAQARPLFRLVQTDPLRIYVKIPQRYASYIKADMMVHLQFAEHPGKQFPAKLIQTARAIDPRTQTLLAQFMVPNKTGKLLAGGYTEVHFTMPFLEQVVRLPVNTLLFRQEGLQVATVNEHHRVVLKKITISRDFGHNVEVLSGLLPGESIILNPSDAIYDGQEVRIAPQMFPTREHTASSAHQGDEKSAM